VDDRIKEIWLLDGNACAFDWQPGNMTRYELSVVRANGLIFVCVGNHGRGVALPPHCFEQRDRTQPSHLAYLCGKFNIPDRLSGDMEAICEGVNVALDMMREERNS
jgi:hypothetical protein